MKFSRNYFTFFSHFPKMWKFREISSHLFHILVKFWKTGLFGAESIKKILESPRKSYRSVTKGSLWLKIFGLCRSKITSANSKINAKVAFVANLFLFRVSEPLHRLHINTRSKLEAKRKNGFEKNILFLCWLRGLWAFYRRPFEWSE